MLGSCSLSVILSEKKRREEKEEKGKRREREEEEKEAVQNKPKSPEGQDEKVHFLKKMSGTILTAPYFSSCSLFNYSNFIASIVTFHCRQKENKKSLSEITFILN